MKKLIISLVAWSLLLSPGVAWGQNTTIDALPLSLAAPTSTDLFLVSDSGIAKKMQFSVLHDGISGGHIYDGGPSSGDTLTLRGNPSNDGNVLVNPSGGNLSLGGTGLTSDTTIFIKTGSSNDAVLRYDTGAGQQWRAYAQGSSSDYIIRDVTGSVSPFVIQNGAPSNTLLLEATGDVGVGGSPAVIGVGILLTRTGQEAVIASYATNHDAALEARAADGLDARVRLIQTSSQKWYLINNGPDDDFHIRDEFASTVPFLIENGAATDTLYVATTGVGIAEDSPARDLHITDTMRIEPRSAAPSSPALGDLYVDSDSNELCFYDGSSWTGLRAGGACA